MELIENDFFFVAADGAEASVPRAQEELGPRSLRPRLALALAPATTTISSAMAQMTNFAKVTVRRVADEARLIPGRLCRAMATIFRGTASALEFLAVPLSSAPKYADELKGSQALLAAVAVGLALSAPPVLTALCTALFVGPVAPPPMAMAARAKEMAALARLLRAFAGGMDEYAAQLDVYCAPA